MLLLAGDPFSMESWLLAAGRAAGRNRLERSREGWWLLGRAFLFQMSRQETGQAEAASDGLSLPDIAVQALHWCNTTVLLLDSSRSLWVAVNSLMPLVTPEISGQSRICWHWWRKKTLASSEGVWVTVRHGRAPLVWGHREPRTTAWAGATAAEGT